MKRCVAGGRRRAGRPGRGRRPRPAAAGAHPAAQLPGARPRPVPAGVDRPGAAPVPGGRQQRGAAVHPRPAALGLRVGEEGEQLLRLRHRQRPRVHRRLPGHQPPHVRPGRAADARARPGRTSPLPCAKVLGGRPRPARRRSGPSSVVNISAMSFGSLSGAAIEALNRGAALAGCLHNTGEGGLSPHHRHGGELVFQIGTAYFGCRDEHGRFDLDRLKDLVAGAPVRALEIKLSQGAKPGLGGVLPGGEGVGRDRRDPRRARGRGLHQPVPARGVLRRRQPAGLGRAAGRRDRAAGRASSPPSATWASGTSSTDLMATTGRGVDFVTIDGGEGGTGAAPLIFTDSVSLPFQLGFARVYSTFAARRPARAGRSSSAPASSACRTTRSSPSRSAATWSTSPARRCWRSAASRRRSATPTPARPASPPRTPGWPTAWTRR